MEERRKEGGLPGPPSLTLCPTLTCTFISVRLEDTWTVCWGPPSSMTESKCELFTVASGETVQGQKEQAAPMGFFERYVQPCLAELIGSTLFIFVGCISVIGNVGITGSIQPALAHGLALAIVVAVFGEIRSGLQTSMYFYEFCSYLVTKLLFKELQYYE